MASGHEDQRVRLSAWTWRDSLDLLGEVAASGPEGAVALVEQLRVRAEWSERVYLVAALGDATGDGGIAELRVTARATGPHTVDLRCASLLALAKRLREEATADLVVGLGDRDRSVRDYALLGLAAWGDPSAWGAVLAELKNRVRRPSRARPQTPPEVVAVCYLVRTASADQINELAAVLERGWPRLNPEIREPLQGFWPGLADRRADDSYRLPDRHRARGWFVGRCRALLPGIE
jgi:hypothetical protein